MTPKRCGLVIILMATLSGAQRSVASIQIKTPAEIKEAVPDRWGRNIFKPVKEEQLKNDGEMAYLLKDARDVAMPLFKSHDAREKNKNGKEKKGVWEEFKSFMKGVGKKLKNLMGPFGNGGMGPMQDRELDEIKIFYLELDEADRKLHKLGVSAADLAATTYKMTTLAHVSIPNLDYAIDSSFYMWKRTYDDVRELYTTLESKDIEQGQRFSREFPPEMRNYLKWFRSWSSINYMGMKNMLKNAVGEFDELSEEITTRLTKKIVKTEKMWEDQGARLQATYEKEGEIANGDIDWYNKVYYKKYAYKASMRHRDALAAKWKKMMRGCGDDAPKGCEAKDPFMPFKEGLGAGKWGGIDTVQIVKTKDKLKKLTSLIEQNKNKKFIGGIGNGVMSGFGAVKNFITCTIGDGMMGIEDSSCGGSGKKGADKTPQPAPDPAWDSLNEIKKKQTKRFRSREAKNSKKLKDQFGQWKQARGQAKKRGSEDRRKLKSNEAAHEFHLEESVQKTDNKMDGLEMNNEHEYRKLLDDRDRSVKRIQTESSLKRTAFRDTLTGTVRELDKQLTEDGQSLGNDAQDLEVVGFEAQDQKQLVHNTINTEINAIEHEQKRLTGEIKDGAAHGIEKSDDRFRLLRTNMQQTSQRFKGQVENVKTDIASELSMEQSDAKSVLTNLDQSTKGVEHKVNSALNEAKMHQTAMRTQRKMWNKQLQEFVTKDTIKLKKINTEAEDTIRDNADALTTVTSNLQSEESKITQDTVDKVADLVNKERKLGAGAREKEELEMQDIDGDVQKQLNTAKQTIDRSKATMGRVYDVSQNFVTATNGRVSTLVNDQIPGEERAEDRNKESVDEMAKKSAVKVKSIDAVFKGQLITLFDKAQKMFDNSVTDERGDVEDKVAGVKKMAEFSASSKGDELKRVDQSMETSLDQFEVSNSRTTQLLGQLSDENQKVTAETRAAFAKVREKALGLLQANNDEELEKAIEEGTKVLENVQTTTIATLSTATQEEYHEELKKRSEMIKQVMNDADRTFREKKKALAEVDGPLTEMIKEIQNMAVPVEAKEKAVESKELDAKQKVEAAIASVREEVGDVSELVQASAATQEQLVESRTQKIKDAVVREGGIQDALLKGKVDSATAHANQQLKMILSKEHLTEQEKAKGLAVVEEQLMQTLKDVAGEQVFLEDSLEKAAMQGNAMTSEDLRANTQLGQLLHDEASARIAMVAQDKQAMANKMVDFDQMVGKVMAAVDSAVNRGLIELNGAQLAAFNQLKGLKARTASAAAQALKDAEEAKKLAALVYKKAKSGESLTDKERQELDSHIGSLRNEISGDTGMMRNRLVDLDKVRDTLLKASQSFTASTTGKGIEVLTTISEVIEAASASAQSGERSVKTKLAKLDRILDEVIEKADKEVTAKETDILQKASNTESKLGLEGEWAKDGEVIDAAARAADAKLGSIDEAIQERERENGVARLAADRQVNGYVAHSMDGLKVQTQAAEDAEQTRVRQISKDNAVWVQSTLGAANKASAEEENEAETNARDKEARIAALDKDDDALVEGSKKLNNKANLISAMLSKMGVEFEESQASRATTADRQRKDAAQKLENYADQAGAKSSFVEDGSTNTLANLRRASAEVDSTGQIMLSDMTPEELSRLEAEEDAEEAETAKAEANTRRQAGTLDRMLASKMVEVPS